MSDRWAGSLQARVTQDISVCLQGGGSACILLHAHWDPPYKDSQDNDAACQPQLNSSELIDRPHQCWVEGTLLHLLGALCCIREKPSGAGARLILHQAGPMHLFTSVAQERCYLPPRALTCG